MSTEKKIIGSDDSRIEFASTTVITAVSEPRRKLDEAYEYLQTHHDQHTLHNAAELKRLRRKIDWRIVPILSSIFGIQFLDKYMLNYAIVMGLPEDLKLKGNELNNIASSLWIAYLVATVPLGFAVNKLPVAKWLGTMMTIWGIIVGCVAAAKDYHSLLAIRILMGIFDASVPPCLMLICSQYYRKDEQSIRFAFWFSAIGSMTVVGGLLSYGFQSIEHSSMASWRLMYLVLGIISLAIGIWSLLCLPDTPMQARFLTDTEKATILQHVSINETGISDNSVKFSQLVDLVTDPQVYLLASIVMLAACGAGIMGTYSSTMIRSFGYDSKEAALLNTPGGAVGFVFVLGTAFFVRYAFLQRWSIIFICKCCAIIGGCLLAFTPRTNHSAQLAGIYIFNCALPASGIAWQWTAANISGHTKRSIAMAIKSAAFAVGQIVAPYAVQKKEAPEFHTAKKTILATQAASAGLVVVLAVYYWVENKRRDRVFGRQVSSDADSEVVANMEEMWVNKTDREREGTFRYVY